MATTTRKQHKEIIGHVLDVVGIEEEQASKITAELKFNVIGSFKMISADELKIMRESGAIAFGEVVAIKRIQNWLRNNEEPKSLDDWKKAFTEESLNAFEAEPQVPTGNVQAVHSPHGSVEQNSLAKTESNRRAGEMSVKFSDYPDFSGKHTEWYAYKAMHMSTAKVHGYSDLLNVSDMDAHLERRTEDSEYNYKVSTMHSILYKKTAKGTAFSKVKQYESTEDGVLAWNALKNYYDQEGNKSLYGTNRLNELIDLKLKYSTFGGFDKYQNDFDVLCNQLEDCGHGLPDDQKRTMFIKNIEDPDYDTTMQLCYSDDYATAVQKLRARAAMLGRQSGPAKRSQNKVTKKPGKKGSGQNDKKEDERERLPRDVGSNVTRSQEAVS